MKIRAGWLILASCVLTLGCQRTPPPVAATPPTEVVVTRPVRQTVTDYEEYTGRTEAIASVDIRARVTGYLDKVHFKDGTMVKQGELLFEIDPRTYEAQLHQAESQVRLNEAQLKYAQAEYERSRRLMGTGASSREDVEKTLAARDTAEASVQAAKADVARRKLDVEFTKVTAPVSGRIGRRQIDPGNLVKADDTVLTNIVTLDPLYVNFDVDERTMLKVRRLIRQGKVQSAQEARIPVYLELSDEQDFPHEGFIDFVDNKVDPNTATLRVRGQFANPDLILSPGVFARVRVRIGAPYEALLVPEQALGTDQGQRFVYVVNADNVVEYRRVRVGSQHDGLRVIEEGLQPDEQIIVRGLQRVRPGAKVQPRPEASGSQGSGVRGPESEKQGPPSSSGKEKQPATTDSDS